MITTKIEGQTMVFKNDKGFYSTSIGTKKADGTYNNAYIPLQFKKGVSLENKAQINIKNAFLAFEKYTPANSNKEVTVWKIVVLDFEPVGAAKTANKSTQQSDFQIVDDEDLPF